MPLPNVAQNPSHKRVSFADLPDEQRYSLYKAIEATGADVQEYADQGVTVALPSPAGDAMRQISELGLELASLWYFPLGSDKPMDALRHYGPGTATAPRGDHPSYWLKAHYLVGEKLIGGGK